MIKRCKCAKTRKIFANLRKINFFIKKKWKKFAHVKKKQYLCTVKQKQLTIKTITIMKTETTMSYKNLVEYCEKLAHELHTIMKTREYTEFGWASIVFETDKFGGDYVNLHYDLNTGIVTNWYGSDRARVVDTLEQLKMMVKYYMKKMSRARDMNAVSDFINSQY